MPNAGRAHVGPRCECFNGRAMPIPSPFGTLACFPAVCFSALKWWLPPIGPFCGPYGSFKTPSGSFWVLLGPFTVIPICPLFMLVLTTGNAISERGFSAMSSVHTKSRSQLSVKQCRANMIISFNGASYQDFSNRLNAESLEKGKTWWGFVDTQMPFKLLSHLH